MSTKLLRACISTRKLRRDRAQITYPIIRVPNPKIQRRINLLVRRMLISMLRHQGYGEPNVSITATYAIHLNARCICSLSLEVYAIADKAAHGTTIQKSLTVNLLSGRLYLLPSLFRPRSNYIERLSQEIKKQIEEKEIPLIAEFDHIRANQDYYLTARDLVIYFQQYEYTPGAWGLPVFKMPLTSLADILSRRGPAYRFLPRRRR